MFAMPVPMQRWRK